MTSFIDSKAPPVELKIVFVGSQGVGKTSIINRYINDNFKEGQQMTLGVMFFTKSVDYEGNTYKLNINDTAGQERFKAVASLYFKDAQGVIIVGDISDPSNYMQSIEKWYEEVNSKSGEDPVIIMVGNKIDM